MYAASERILVDQVVGHVAEMELLRPKLASHNNPLDAASHMLGEACVQLAFSRNSQRDYNILTEQPLAVLNELRRDGEAPQATVAEARMLYLGGLMIRYRNFPTEIQDIHQRLRMETASQLGFTLDKINNLRGKEDEKRRGHLNGRVAQLTTLALLNQSDLTNYGALYSPPHLEKTRKQHRNYDVGFHFADGDEEVSQALQVKLACGGYCENGSAPEVDQKQLYASDICLVSGCCDLGIGKDYETKLIDLSIPMTLVDQQYSPDIVGKRARHRLNVLSENLADTILAEGKGDRAGTSKRGQSKVARAA